MSHFDHCASLDELKAAYKKLALKHHPDMCGDVRTMQEVNAEYDKVFAVLKELQNFEAGKSESKTRATTEAPEEFRAVVDALLKLKGIEVELCGSWLWIGGNTYPHREALKEAGCLWSRSKKRWYWRHAEDDCKWSRGTATMSQIRGKYGSEWLRKADEREALLAQLRRWGALGLTMRPIFLRNGRFCKASFSCKVSIGGRCLSLESFISAKVDSRQWPLLLQSGS